MYILNSILDNIESTISQGDLMVDPFYILDIQKINIGEDVSFSQMFYYIIDNDKLNKYTKDFNYSNWKHLASNKFINNPDELNEKIIRFLWYICYNIVYRDAKYMPKSISIADILKLDSLFSKIYIYIYKSNIENNEYTLEFLYAGCTIASIIIKNIEHL